MYNIYTSINEEIISMYSYYYIIIIMLLIVIGGVIYKDENKRWGTFYIRYGIYGIVNTVLLIMNNNEYSYEIFYNQIKSELIYTTLQSILLLTTVSVLLMTEKYIKTNYNKITEYILLIMLGVIGMLLLLVSNDFLTIYLTLELQSISLYILASYKVESSYSTESGIKYFIIGALASGLILLGIALVYSTSGSTNLDEINLLMNHYHGNTYTLQGGYALIVIGLLCKIGIVPFHMWVPDVYEGAPTMVTAYFSLVPKISLWGIIIKILSTIYVYHPNIFLITYCALGSIILGTLGAIYQKRIKRFLAYSGIVHGGYLLCGLVAGTLEGIQGILFYLIVYVIIMVNIFTTVMSLQSQINGSLLKLILKFRSLIKSNTLLVMNFALILFSLASIPPLMGFYSKIYIIFALIQGNLSILALGIIMLSIIGAVYYIRLIKLTSFTQTKEWTYFIKLESMSSGLLSVSSIFNIIFFINPLPLFLWIQEGVLLYYI